MNDQIQLFPSFTQKIQNCVEEMLQEAGKAVVFFERNYKTQHLQIQVQYNILWRPIKYKLFDREVALFEIPMRCNSCTMVCYGHCIALFRLYRFLPRKPRRFKRRWWGVLWVKTLNCTKSPHTWYHSGRVHSESKLWTTWNLHTFDITQNYTKTPHISTISQTTISDTEPLNYFPGNHREI